MGFFLGSLALGGLFPASVARAQQGLGTPGGPDGTISREEMWRAPTREEWAKPCLITWQRNWEDAIAVSRETGKPLLVCVNMDGEIASEHYAGVRYRQPETAALYDPYVCVMASVYRHTPKDYDVRGRRIPCPRFGGVTCGEHIAIEPGLFGEYFEGQRVAPRHIMIELDQSEVYDVFYAFDTDSVFDMIKKGIAERPEVPPPFPRADQTLVDRVSSPDTADREAIEVAYLRGTREVRQQLLQAALENLEVAQVDLLRLALFGEDQNLKQLAWRALSESAPDSAVTLLGDALAVMTEDAEREPLIASLMRLGENSSKARALARVHQGLDSHSGTIDLAEWGAALASAEYEVRVPGSFELDTRVENSAEAALARPEDFEANLELAESYLALARHPDTDPKFARLFLEDAHNAALEAEAQGASGWRVNAAVALTARQLGNFELALERAEAAVNGMPSSSEGWNAFAALDLFARFRQRAIADAYRDKREWPSEWLTDLHTAYSLLAQHPLGTDEHTLRHYDFLDAIGAKGHAGRVLDAGLERFPGSWGLHDRLRGRALAESGSSGIGGLEALYERMLDEQGDSTELHWFAAYASMVAAEYQRRAGESVRAREAYDRAIARYEELIGEWPQERAASDHYVAMAYAGIARLAYEAGDEEQAVDRLLASFQRKPDAAASLDGLGFSAAGTAKAVLARLRRQGREDLATRLRDALSGLDPKMLELPAFERGGPTPPPRRRRPGTGRRDR